MEKEKSHLDVSFYNNGLPEEQKREIDRKVAEREVLTQYEIYTLLYETEEEIKGAMLEDEENKKNGKTASLWGIATII